MKHITLVAMLLASGIAFGDNHGGEAHGKDHKMKKEMKMKDVKAKKADAAGTATPAAPAAGSPDAMKKDEKSH